MKLAFDGYIINEDRKGYDARVEARYLLDLLPTSSLTSMV
ncbi:hypothetical protein VTN00DRAFT_7912 [Thermoascus crustaceus]